MTTTLTDDPFGVLRRVLQPRQRPRPGEACEMCGEIVSTQHSHVASLSERRLLCSCRACYLLFTQPGAGARRLRAVPERYAVADDFAFSPTQWDELAIPVELVFLFEQSDLDGAGSRVVACYPSPAGATESELPLESWRAMIADNPLLAGVTPDVEAVLVRRSGSNSYVCLVVPIDACYELVGIVRQHWVGFHGGDEVWRQIDAFFTELHNRAAGRNRGRRA